MNLIAWLKGQLWGEGKHPLEEFGVEELLSQEDLDQALAAGTPGPILIFKHSTACPTSHAAYQRVAAYLEECAAEAPPCYLVKVIESRPISNALAQSLGVTHQSPQMILIRDGKATWNASHGGITAETITLALQA